MENRSLVTIADLSKEKLMYLLRMAGEFEKHPNRKLLEGKVVATLFFEPSFLRSFTYTYSVVFSLFGFQVPEYPLNYLACCFDL